MTGHVPEVAIIAAAARIACARSGSCSLHQIKADMEIAAPILIAPVLRHLAEAFDILAAAADKRAGGAAALSPEGWAGKAVAYEQCAQELRNLIGDMSSTLDTEG